MLLARHDDDDDDDDDLLTQTLHPHTLGYTHMYKTGFGIK